MDERREKLAAAQANLLRALDGRVEAPAEFDPRQVRLAATSLRQKRMKMVATAWPELRAWLGDLFAETFADYAAAEPIEKDSDGYVDGYRFAKWVMLTGDAPESVRREVTRYERVGRSRIWRAIAKAAPWAMRYLE